MAIENTPSEGLTMESALAQLQSSRQPAPQGEQPEEERDDVVDETEEYEDDSEEVNESEEDSELDEDDDQEASEEDSEEDVSADEEVFEVDIEGELVEVTGEELVKGYLRHNDYTRKRQAEAKEVKQIKEEFTSKISQLDQALAANISAEEQRMKAVAQKYQQSTDQAERQNLHYQYLQLQQAVQQRNQQLTYAQQLQQQQTQAQAEAQYNEQMNLIKGQFEDWDTRKDQLRGYLEGMGVQDFSPFVNLEMAILVDKAKQFDDLQQTRDKVAKKKLRRKVPSVLKPGSGEKQFHVSQEKSKKANQQFSQSRSINDALSLLRTRRGS